LQQVLNKRWFIAASSE